MPGRRAEDEFGVGLGMEVDRRVRRLEGHELARLHALGTARLPVASAIQPTVWLAGGS